jgi:hypothetical protein
MFRFALKNKYSTAYRPGHNMPKSHLYGTLPLNDGYYRRGQLALATFIDQGYYEGLFPSAPTICRMKRFRTNYTVFFVI